MKKSWQKMLFEMSRDCHRRDRVFGFCRNSRLSAIAEKRDELKMIETILFLFAVMNEHKTWDVVVIRIIFFVVRPSFNGINWDAHVVTGTIKMSHAKFDRFAHSLVFFLFFIHLIVSSHHFIIRILHFVCVSVQWNLTPGSSIATCAAGHR